MKKLASNSNKGFLLLEIAIVLIIFGFVLGGLIVPLAKQKEMARQASTKVNLEEIKRALIGYAQNNSRLPCPAVAEDEIKPGSEGVEQPFGGGTCAVTSGFLPAATLGIQPTDQYGFAIDEWGNRIRYAVSQIKSVSASNQQFTPDNSFTLAGGMSNVGISALDPSLRVCMGTPQSRLTCSISSPETNYLTNNAVAVIFSKGPTGSGSVGGLDEKLNLSNFNLSNLNPNAFINVFVSHAATDEDAPNGEFDHLLVWISPYVLYQAMVQAGKLP